VAGKVPRRRPGCAAGHSLESVNTMTLAQQEHILSALIWLALILGPPLLLALVAPMFYIDGASRGLHLREVAIDNRAPLLLLIIGLCVWVLLLKFLYLPLVGFDTQFLTIGGFTQYDYTDLGTLKTLWGLTVDWVQRNPGSAIPLLAFPLLLGGAVLFVARAQ